MSSRLVFFMVVFTGLLPFETVFAQTREFEGYRYQELETKLPYEERFQWGIGLRINSLLIKQNQSEVTISVVGAVGSSFGKEEFGSQMNWLSPSLHVEFLLARGGMGSALGTDDYIRWHSELRTGILMTYGLNQQRVEVSRPIPLTVMNTARVLDDPYHTSIRLGTVYFWNFKSGAKQRAGNFGLGCGNISIDYHNDGSVLHGWLFLGDEYDRWFTGSGELSFYSKSPYTTLSRLSLGFARYTGFHPYSYEVSTAMGLPYVAYPRLKEQLLNQGRWVLTGEFHSGIRMEAALLDNPFLEFQNLIHWFSGNMSLHPAALEQRWGFGIGYMNRYVQTHE